MAIHVSAAVLLLFQSSEKQEKIQDDRKQVHPTGLHWKRNGFDWATVLMIKGCFLQNVSAAIILFKVKRLFKKANKFLASVARINTYYRLSEAMWTMFSLKNYWLLMILRITPVFYPLPAHIFEDKFWSSRSFCSKWDFTSAKVKGLIVWKWVLCADTRTTPDLTQQHNQITTS